MPVSIYKQPELTYVPQMSITITNHLTMLFIHNYNKSPNYVVYTITNHLTMLFIQ